MALRNVKEIDLQNDAVDDSGLQVVGDTVLTGFRTDRVCLQVVNESAATGDDLASFVVQMKAHPGAPWKDVLGGTGLQWSSPGSVAVMVTDPSTLAKGASSFLNIHTGVIHAVRFQAQAATGKTCKIGIRGTAYLWGAP